MRPEEKWGIFRWNSGIEKVGDSVFSIGRLDLIHMKGTGSHGYNRNNSEQIYWINLGKYKIRWWKN